jgi:N6-adenosine-specific RNA methylase IME4
MKFQVICADPPYSFADKLSMSSVRRGASANYNTMTMASIKAMPVRDIVDPEGAILALWVPSSLLSDGLDIMDSWGFAMKQTWIWVKTKNNPLNDLTKFLTKNTSVKGLAKTVKETMNEFSSGYWYNQLLSFNMGHIARNTHEIVLVGTRGDIYSKIENRSERTVFFDKALKHSKKTELLQDKLDRIFPDPKLNRLEIFARRQRNGWYCIGNECPTTLGQDILLSVEKLKIINA